MHGYLWWRQRDNREYKSLTKRVGLVVLNHSKMIVNCPSENGLFFQKIYGF